MEKNPSPFRTRESLLTPKRSEKDQAEFDHVMELAHEIMDEYREALAKLAKL